MKLRVQVGLGTGHIVLGGGPAAPPLKEHSPSPQFSAHICCGQMAAWIKMSFGTEVGLGPGDFVLDGDPAHPSSKGGQSPPPKKKNSAYLYCGQTAGWMKLLLGMEVGLSPGDLDGDPVLFPQKGAESLSPIFGPFLFWPNGWKHQDATRYGGRPQPRRVCVRLGPSPPPQMGGGAELPPNFKG